MNIPTDSWGLEEDDEEIEYYWSTDYFDKIDKLMDCREFDLYLDYHTFIKKYDIDDDLVKFLTNNIKYYHNNFIIDYLTDTSMYGICLCNKPIVYDTFKQKLDTYLESDKVSNNDLLLIFLNIIISNKLELFKYLFDKYPEIVSTGVQSPQTIYYSKIKYNIINHSLLCSPPIFNYLLNHVDVYKYVLNHLNLYLDFNVSYKCQDLISNNIVINNNIQEYSFTNFMTICIENKKYNKLIEILILKINDYEIINTYIGLCIRHLKYNLINTYFEKRKLLLKELKYNCLLHFLIEMFEFNETNLANHTYILKIWSLIFPYIEKYSSTYIYEYFSNVNINNIVAYKKSIDIVIQLAPYISDWNKLDYCGFSPILDAIRYGKYETVYYMIVNYDIDLTIASLDRYNILSCALMNSDLRIIDYIYKTIIEDDPLLNIVKREFNIYDITSIFSNIKKRNFREFKTKFDIIIDLYGTKYIDNFVDSFINYKSFIVYIITKYNYKIKINKNYNLSKCFNCSMTNKEYLKLFIDNIDYEKSTDNQIILYISTLGCVDLVIELFQNIGNICKMCNIDPNILNWVSFKVYDNIVSNKCTKCTHYDKRKCFIKYIDFMKSKFNINMTGRFYNSIHSDFNNYTNICDILYKNGIYFDNINYVSGIESYNRLININSFQMMRMSNMLVSFKENTIYNIEFIKWNLAICYLKSYVRRRFNKYKHTFMEKILPINNHITFTKSIVSNFRQNIPTHLTPLDCFNPLNETHKYISMKADGIYKRGIFNVYPNNIEENDLFEYEFIRDDNMCYIFDTYENIMKLRRDHLFIPQTIYSRLNLINYKEILLDYEEEEKEALNKFIGMYKYKKKWWAKYVFKIDDMCPSDYLKLLDGISKLELDCIDNDGWILYGEDSTYKIKPKKLLTIDLMYKLGNMYDNQNQVYDVLKNDNLIENTIYRCYYNNNMWEARDIRYDKFKANDRDLCAFIEKSHKLPWNIGDIKLVNKYYQKSFISKSPKNTKMSYNLSNVLDLGCGFSKKYVGIDIDPKVLLHPKKGETYICDITKDWCLSTKNNIYNYLPNINDFKKKYEGHIFDVILSKNSIHYLLNGEHDILFGNINKYVRVGSLFKIKFLDKDLVNELIKDQSYINNGGSFVRNHGAQIKIYYDWCHTNPIIETLYDKWGLEEIFNKYGWILGDYKYNKMDNVSDWDNYFRCFSDISFIRT